MKKYIFTEEIKKYNLIYAVDLEENTNVINEIFDYRGEKSLENTFNKINTIFKE